MRTFRGALVALASLAVALALVGQIDDGGNKVNGSTFSIPPQGGIFNNIP